MEDRGCFRPSCRLCLLGLSLLGLLEDVQDVDVDRAVVYTAAATDAGYHVELFGEVRVLVADAVARTLLARRPGVVPRGVQGVLGEHAGVPHARAPAVEDLGLVLDVEAVAGRAQEGADPAGEAPVRELLPERVVVERRELLGDAL